MDNTTLQSSSLFDFCPPPFLNEASYPRTGGFVDGRFCAPISALPNSPVCCLPCPAAKWAYSDSFYTWLTVSEWLNVLGIILLVFMLLSYIVLPVQQTRSHYLSVCLIVAVIMMAIGFTIPLAAQPEQCYNDITPNDMYSLTECAWSGAFIVAGGLSTAMWIFIRALSMNLQICWDIIPGQKFFYYSQALGWGIPAILFTATMTFTGVSFRFGRECDVNRKNSMQDFWGPLLGMVGAAGVAQLMTFVHCLRVYLRNLFTEKNNDPSTGGSSTGLPSYGGSSRVTNQTARVVWRRLQKVLWLQWRGIAIVTVMLVDVIFFSIVFVWLDGLQKEIADNFDKVEPWIECLALHPTDKGKCLPLANELLVNQPTVIAVLLLISLGGLQIFLFVARPTIFPSWWNFFRSKFTRQQQQQQEFVSLDARPDNIVRTSSKQGLVTTYTHERGGAFEMQTPRGKEASISIDDKPTPISPTHELLSTPEEAYTSPLLTNHSTSPYSSTRPLSGRARPAPYPKLTSNPTASPPTPVVRYDGISLSRQDSDYFANSRKIGASPTRPGTTPTPPPHYMQHQPRGESRASMNSERRYQPPHASFSAPQAPSRNSSMKTNSIDIREAALSSLRREGTGSSRGVHFDPSPSDLVESPSEDLEAALGRQRVMML